MGCARKQHNLRNRRHQAQPFDQWQDPWILLRVTERADLRQAIVGGATDPLAVGDPVPMDNGAKNTEMSAIAMRVEEDTDTTSTTYAQYLSSGTGNGERVVYVAVNNGAPNYINMGFAGSSF